ncbi:MAG: EAL domain-containing protein [gamma proteobacterium symbiont of Phacoides pectinatus]
MQNEELRYTQQVLSGSREKYSRLFESAPVGYCNLDKDGIVKECNQTLARMLGHPKEKIIRFPFASFVLAEDTPILNHMLHQPTTETEYQIRLLDPQRRCTHALVRMHRFKSDRDGERRSMAALTDISRLNEMATQLKTQGLAIENIQEAVCIADNGSRILFVNRAFEEVTGLGREGVLGRRSDQLLFEQEPEELRSDVWRKLQESGRWRGKIRQQRADGRDFPAQLSISISTINDDRGYPQYYVAVFTDITHEEMNREHLNRLAFFDSLTGLPNRQLFFDRLQQEIARARRERERERERDTFGLLYMDLDRFKNINDTLGHSVGDELLVKTGERLRALLRENDTVARMGGDEFIVLLPHMLTHRDATRIAGKILRAMERPFELAGASYHIGTSIGFSRYPHDGLDSDTLVKHADIAMYRAKANGSNGFHALNDSLTERIHDRVELEHDLRQAFAQQALYLVYQPQIELATGRCCGAEALLRWEHPHRGMIPTPEFIGIAEENGQIIDIGYWVLRKTAEQFQAWAHAGSAPDIVWANLSPRQFLHRDLVHQIRQILDATGMPPERLGIEVTENAAMPNLDYSIEPLKGLRAMGIRVSIDDFGAGFSSFGHLRHLPLDGLKIDRQFIARLPGEANDSAITSAIIAMAQALKLTLVAEGVETVQQMDFLRARGCDIVQGFYLAKPLDPRHLATYLKELESTPPPGPVPDRPNP